MSALLSPRDTAAETLARAPTAQTSDIPQSISNLEWLNMRLSKLTTAAQSCMMTGINETWKAANQCIQLLPEQLARIRDGVSHVARAVVLLEEGHGVGGSANVILGVGAQAGIELVNIGGKIAVYCLAGVKVANDAGASIGTYRLHASGCKSHEDYVGTFVSAGLGVSCELAAIPVGVDASVSAGFQTGKFRAALEKEIRDGTLQLSEIRREISKIIEGLLAPAKGAVINSASAGIFMPQVFMVHYLAALGPELGIGPEHLRQLRERAQKDTQGLQFSRDAINPKAWLTKAAASIQGAENLKNTHRLISLIGEHLTECNTIAARGGLTLSLLPVAVEGGISEYVKLAEFDLSEIEALAKESSSAMLELTRASFDFGLKNACIRLTESAQDAYRISLEFLKLLDPAHLITQCGRAGINTGKSLWNLAAPAMTGRRAPSRSPAF